MHLPLNDALRLRRLCDVGHCRRRYFCLAEPQWLVDGYHLASILVVSGLFLSLEYSLNRECVRHVGILGFVYSKKLIFVVLIMD